MFRNENARTSPLSALSERARMRPDEIVLVCGYRQWTAGSLLDKTDRLASALASRGVRPGDRVAIHMFNIAEAAIAYLACLRLGAIAAPLNTRFKTEELASWVARMTPAIYLGQVDLYGNFAGVPQDLLPDARRFLVGSPAGSVGRWSELIENRDSGGNFVSPAPDATAVLLATSGTTSGRSKLVVWTHRTVAALTGAGAARGFFDGGIRPLATPLMHASGVSALMLTCLTLGCTLVLVPWFDPDLVLDAIERHRGTSFGGLPYMFAALTRCQAERPRDTASLKLCTVAGDACPTWIAQSFREQFGLPLLGMWGSTEDSGATIPSGNAGALTRLVPGAQARVVDAVGTDVAEGQMGELWLKSQSTTPGYWEGPGKITPLPDGYFRTGDLVRMTGTDEFEYVARTKDIIVRGGSNISPLEIEEVLQSCPQVVEAAVAGVADPALGQRVGALLVIEGPVTDQVVSAVLSTVRQRLADYKVPEVVALANQLPRGASTKIDRKAVAAILAHEAEYLAI